MRVLSITDPAAQALRGREPLFHRLPPGATPEMVSALMAPGFFEVGASGRRYDSAFVLDVVTRRYASAEEPDDTAWDVRNFAVHELDHGLYLATYLLRHRGRSTRRSTIWAHSKEHYAAVYHQGTPIPDPPPGATTRVTGSASGV